MTGVKRAGLHLCVQHDLSIAPATRRIHQRGQQERADALAAPGVAHGHAADVAVGQQAAGAHGPAVGVIGDGVQAKGVAGVEFFFQRHLLFFDEDLKTDAAGLGTQAPRNWSSRAVTT